MIERNDAADDPARLAHREIDHARTHGDRRAFHLRHQAGVKLDLRGGDGGVHHHLTHRIATVGGVDQRQFLGALAQHIGDALKEPRALERRRVAPTIEGFLRRADRGIDVVCAAIGDGAERLARAGIDRVDMAAGFRRMPGATVKRITMVG